jgi:hypothetical protein
MKEDEMVILSPTQPVWIGHDASETKQTSSKLETSISHS